MTSKLQWFIRAGILAALFVNVAVITWLSFVVLHDVSLHPKSGDDAATEAESLAAVGGLLLTSVLAWVTAWYAWVTRQMLQESKLERQFRDYLHQSEQARLVSGFLEHDGESDDGSVIRLTVTNASALPIRGIRGFAVDANSGQVVGAFVPIPVAEPGSEVALLEIANCPPALRLQLTFDDDNGTTWQKYGDKPLEKLTAGSPIFGALDQAG